MALPNPVWRRAARRHHVSFDVEGSFIAVFALSAATWIACLVAIGGWPCPHPAHGVTTRCLLAASSLIAFIIAVVAVPALLLARRRRRRTAAVPSDLLLAVAGAFLIDGFGLVAVEGPDRLRVLDPTTFGSSMNPMPIVGLASFVACLWPLVAIVWNGVARSGRRFDDLIGPAA